MKYIKSFKNNSWFPIFKAELQKTKSTRIMLRIWMKFGRPLLLWTLITKWHEQFLKKCVKGHLSHFIILRRKNRLIESRICLWREIFGAEPIFGPWPKSRGVSSKFEIFVKFLNKVSVLSKGVNSYPTSWSSNWL